MTVANFNLPQMQQYVVKNVNNLISSSTLKPSDYDRQNFQMLICLNKIQTICKINHLDSTFTFVDVCLCKCLPHTFLSKNKFPRESSEACHLFTFKWLYLVKNKCAY